MSGRSATRKNGQQPTVLQLGKYYVPYKGGIESHLQSLCESLAPRCGLEVVAASVQPKTVRENYRGVPVTRVASAGKLLATPLTPGMVPWLINHNGHDLFHLHHPNPFATFAYLAARPPGHLVVSYHSDIVRQRNVLFAYEVFQRQLLRRADVILVSSPNYLHSSSALQPYADKCRIIPYGIDPTRFQDTPEQVELERRIRERFGPRLVLGVGRLVGYKGFNVLVNAMRDLDASLLLAGHGPMRDSLERQAAALGIRDRVHFLGEVKTGYLTGCYRACEVFVLPSVARNESFGIVQLEAMAAGKPVVSTALDSGVPFVNQHGKTGIVVPPGNAEALTNALATLLDNPGYARLLGRNGRRRVEEEFANDVMVERIWSVYQELIARGQRSSRTAPSRRTPPPAQELVFPMLPLRAAAVH